MRDDGFKADHAKLQDELNQKRKIFEKEIVETREKRFDELEASISKERTCLQYRSKKFSKKGYMLIQT